MLQFIVSIIGGLRKAKKLTKKLNLIGRAVSSGEKFIELIKGIVIGYIKGFFIVIVLVAVILGGIAESIKGIYEFFQSKGGNSYDPIAISKQITEEEANMLVETGSLNAKKLQMYAQIESDSYPKSAKVKMHTIDDGKDIISDYNLDLTSFSSKFKIPWQFTAGIDIINDTANEKNNITMTDAVKTNMATTFQWGYDKYTKDEIDSRKEWVVETTQDKDTSGLLIGNKTIVKDTESQARQIDVIKKWPLPFADEVTTPFKRYLYEYQLDKVTRDDPWSEPIVVNTKEWDEVVQDGWEDDLENPIYENDENSPIYGDDTTKPEYEFVIYNKFKLFLKDKYFELRDNITGGYKFTGNEWFQPIAYMGSSSIFQDISYKGSRLTVTLDSKTVSYNDEFFFIERVARKEWTGKYKKKIIGYGKMITGYQQKPRYKTVRHVETSYKRIKKKIVEDIRSDSNEYTDPQRLISFFDSNNINLDDLGIIYAMLEDMPNTGGLKNDIKDIIDGNYSNSGVAGIGGGVFIDGSSLSSEIPLFIQWDKRWGTIPYGNSGTIASSGCGPTAMAMVLTGLKGNIVGIDRNNDGIVDPSEAAAYSIANGFRVEGQGTAWGFFSNIGSKAGLKVAQVSPSNYTQILDHLLKGNPVIASMGPSTFTKGGHFIVLTGVDTNGKITVKDPNSEIKSNQSWDFISTIIAEGRQFWLVENPNMFNNEGVFQVTAYGGVHNAMEGGGFTADGTSLDDKDFRHRIIAVDRTQIKLGSKVYMELPESKRYIYKDGVKYDLNGWYTARDTGGAIKTNRIDLFIGFGGAEDIKRVNDFGRVNGVKVRWKSK